MVNWGDSRLPDGFWDRVLPCPMSGCWLWTGKIWRSSPRFLVSEGPLGARRWRQVSARQYAYDALIGRKPGQTRAMNACGVDECCNPSHSGLMHKAALARKAREKLVAWRKRNRAKLVDNQRKHLYGLDRSEIDRIAVAQDGSCAVCGEVFDEANPKRRACVDHDHETGAIRGLLCRKCNAGLGMLRDRSDLLRAAADYLERHAKRKVA